MPVPSESATDLFLALRESGAHTDPRLDPLVYEEVRRLAQSLMRRERASHTLQPTALANEAYLRLIDQERVRPEDRQHFLVLAARAMRRILIDHARARGAVKRGGGWQRMTLSDNVLGSDKGELDLLELEDALKELAAFDQRKASIVELRFFAGMTVREITDCLGMSLGTVSGEWQAARAWLAVRLDASPQRD